MNDLVRKLARCASLLVTSVACSEYFWLCVVMTLGSWTGITGFYTLSFDEIRLVGLRST